MKRVIHIGMIGVLVLSGHALEGCSSSVAPYSIRSGFRAVTESNETPDRRQVVIWSNYAQVEQPILHRFEQMQGGDGGNSTLQQAFAEMGKALPQVPQDAEILQLARQAGADEAIITEVTIKPVLGDEGSYTYVAVRDFGVKTGTMRWSGAVHCSRPVRNAEKVVIQLARVALGVGMGLDTQEMLVQEGIHVCREEPLVPE